jgi:hypothetical protein
VAHYKEEDDVNLVFWQVLCKPPETNGLCLRLSSSDLYFLHYTTAVNLLLFFRFFLNAVRSSSSLYLSWIGCHLAMLMDQMVT